jgi:UDP-N-acetylmuramoyl-L-alanyl-D-glutamate--2,6-diaminopimelate ligase
MGGPTAVVDYAHTPDALDKALAVLRRHCSGKLSVVFGCGGDRDRGKRPEMGAIAARRADHVVLTDDNPRNEDGARIIADIQAGMSDFPVAVIRDRRTAIAQTLAGATANDVVLVAGKGHEEYQIVGNERHYFSDQKVAREVLGIGP